ncbi:MAG: DUF3883 domain-containing protein, partial [Armatimonadetes bacterium]|nr:DUF3883 domain-containing protein [Armatimonadota bacterium]
PDAAASPPVGEVEQFLLEEALQPFADGVAAGRLHEVETVSRHVEISLGALLLRQNLKLAELVAQHQRGETAPLLAANLKQAEDRVEELTGRLERRRAELAQERHCLIGGVEHVGRALVLPHPERGSPAVAPMIRDETVERIAVDAVIAYEEARGWRVESVESENRGFDLISRRPHPEDPATSIAVRFIEVKGRAATGDVALTANEYQTAERLKGDYWLYVVFNCGTTPEVHTIQNPARLDWKPVLAIEHYRLAASGLEV